MPAYISTASWPYRIVTSITRGDGDTYSQHVQDFETFGEAFNHFEAASCSLRVIGHELVQKADGAVLERKGWIYGRESGDFDFRRASSGGRV
jgi:hypothetical protein